MNTNLDHQDIIVVGGGHAGLIQTLLLAQQSFKVTCLDSASTAQALDPTQDGRTTAISYGSHQLLKAANVWEQLKPHACAIKSIDILDGHSPVLLDFSIQDIEANNENAAFGWIIENHMIKKVLFDAIAQEKTATHKTDITVQDFENVDDHIHVITKEGETLSAQLVIGADGRQSFTREWMDVGTRKWSYKQTALVTTVTHEKPHDNVAVEHFLPEGPFAILPMQDDKQGNHRSALVWTQEQNNQNSALSWSDEALLTALNVRFPTSYGNVLKIGKRFSYPLNLIHAYQYVIPRMALIADAAHGIHPIAGQGLNLGLRDVAALTEILSKAKKENKNIGNIQLLKQYQNSRRPDNITMAATTDLLNKLFSNNLNSSRLVRQIGLKIINKIKPAKRFFMKQAMGKAGHLPKLIKKGEL